MKKVPILHFIALFLSVLLPAQSACGFHLLPAVR